MNSRPDLHLPYAIGAGQEQDRANQGCATEGDADVLDQGLTIDPSQGVSAQQVTEAALSIGIDQSPWQQHWPHRTEVSVGGVILLPLLGCKAIFKAQRRREPQYRVAVVPVA
jgi:hypothetical protein